jgi:hypothetical protein
MLKIADEPGVDGNRDKWVVSGGCGPEEEGPEEQGPGEQALEEPGQLEEVQRGQGLGEQVLEEQQRWAIGIRCEKNPIYRSPIKNFPMADIGQYRNTRQERSDVRYRTWPCSESTHACVNSSIDDMFRLANK